MKRIEVGKQKPNFIGCWDIENKKRELEKKQGFGKEFIELVQMDNNTFKSALAKIAELKAK